MRVWWTVPTSAVAWEWRPSTPLLVNATRFEEDDGTQYLAYAETIAGPPRPYMGLPAGQPLVDTTALFCQEANLTPTDVLITWLEGRRAVRWDRTTDTWSAHAVSLRETGPAVGAPDRITPDASGCGVRAAGRIAMSLLGLTPIPTGHDVLAQQVARNQNAW